MINDSAEAAARLSTITTNPLEDAAAEIEHAAQERGMFIVRAALEMDGLIFLDETTLSATQVVDLAASVGTKLLYLKAKQVNACELAAKLSRDERTAETDQARVVIEQELDRVGGFTSMVELGFSHAGVLHVWTVFAPWCDDLDAIELFLKPVAPASEVALGDLEDEEDEDEDVLAGRPAWAPRYEPDQALKARLVEQLAADPVFRRTRRHSEQIAAAQELRDLSEIPESEQRWVIHDIIRAALDDLHRQSEAVLEQLQSQVNKLAAELACDEAFRAARLVDARRRVARDWIATHHAQGLQMPAWWISELVAITRDYRDGQTSLM